MTQLIHEWQGLDTEQSEVLDMSIWVSASNSSTHLEIFEGLAGYERWSIRQIGRKSLQVFPIFLREKLNYPLCAYLPIWLALYKSITKSKCCFGMWLLYCLTSKTAFLKNFVLKIWCDVNLSKCINCRQKKLCRKICLIC